MQIGITRKAITQIGITQKGITQKDITRKGIKQIGITQKAITQIETRLVVYSADKYFQLLKGRRLIVRESKRNIITFETIFFLT